VQKATKRLASNADRANVVGVPSGENTSLGVDGLFVLGQLLPEDSPAGRKCNAAARHVHVDDARKKYQVTSLAWL
jgi:hypothetical protein